MSIQKNRVDVACVLSRNLLFQLNFEWKMAKADSTRNFKNGISWQCNLCNRSTLRFDRFNGPFVDYTGTINLTDSDDTPTIIEVQASYIRNFLIVKLNKNESPEPFFYSLVSMLFCTVFSDRLHSITPPS